MSSLSAYGRQRYPRASRLGSSLARQPRAQVETSAPHRIEQCAAAAPTAASLPIGQEAAAGTAGLRSAALRQNRQRRLPSQFAQSSGRSAGRGAPAAEAHPPSGGTIPVNTEFAILEVAAGSPAQPAA